jgi:hypothetical protein
MRVGGAQGGMGAVSIGERGGGGHSRALGSVAVGGTLFLKLRGGAGSKRYGMDFFVHVNEQKKIREIITVYAPVNGKIHSILL